MNCATGEEGEIGNGKFSYKDRQDDNQDRVPEGTPFL